MTDAEQVRHETDTEVIPPVSSGEGIARTRELPVVEDAGPAPTQVPAPTSTPTPTPDPEPTQVVSASETAPAADAAPREASQSRPAPSPASQVAPAATRTAGAEGSRWRSGFWALVAVLVIAAVTGVVVLRDRGDLGVGGGRGAAAAVPISATISSLDPSGGSGFRSEGGTWRTQTYQSANFGNLKSGVGLLLDVGAPRTVSAVTFEVEGGAVAVELRAGDERGGSAAYSRVTSAGAASGPTTLTVKNGAKHRYWLIWVTRLAAQSGGFRAVIRDPVVKGPAN